MTQRLLAGSLMAGTLCLLAATASVQQSAPAPTTPSTPAPAAAPAAADKIPLYKLKAPKGFNLELYASGMPNLSHRDFCRPGQCSEHRRSARWRVGAR
jgi:hypothetical protein